MEKDKIIYLWLDAEEENRKHTQEGDNKCLELKEQFSNEFQKLSLKDKQYIVNYLESVAG
jgi:hypothetical protein